MKEIIIFSCFIALVSLSPFGLCSQCPGPVSANCQGMPASSLNNSMPANITFTFDAMSQYTGGITQSGSTILYLKVLPNNASCKWALRVYIDNNGGSGTPPNQWEKVFSYSKFNSGTEPTLDLLQVKVYNSCRTPIFNGIFREFAPVDDSYLDIIDGAALIPAGSCTTNVNGAGSYLTNYAEYSFTIDYRIVPNMKYEPGTYQISLWFCLVEET